MRRQRVGRCSVGNPPHRRTLIVGMQGGRTLLTLTPGLVQAPPPLSYPPGGGTPSGGGTPGLDMNAVFAAFVAQAMHGAGLPGIGGYQPPKPESKSAWARTVDETKLRAKSGVFPKVLKLTRLANHKSKRDAASDSDVRKVSLGNDVSITLSGGASDRTVAGPSDDTLWTHLSGFFRLFAILSAMPEADFARPKLAEMMLFWADLWDSPRGSALKTKAAVEFFNDNFELLGQGDKLIII